MATQKKRQFHKASTYSLPPNLTIDSNHNEYRDHLLVQPARSEALKIGEGIDILILCSGKFVNS